MCRRHDHVEHLDVPALRPDDLLAPPLLATPYRRRCLPLRDRNRRCRQLSLRSPINSVASPTSADFSCTNIHNEGRWATTALSVRAITVIWLRTTRSSNIRGIDPAEILVRYRSQHQNRARVGHGFSLLPPRGRSEASGVLRRSRKSQNAILILLRCESGVAPRSGQHQVHRMPGTVGH